MKAKTLDRGDAPSPLPEKIALILQESRWLALVVLAGFLSLALFGYHADDPGWSRAVFTSTLHNPA
ncbi:MAG TPA: DNA translocase FtsK 4TM domain-containing protein, partial [Azospira sp.]|nr:DNA translocase FtsK 4TM domain-containing protein [Azospira sp.]